MFGFISPAVTGFGQAVAGAAVSRSHVRVSRVSMKISPAMPFMEQPAVLDDESIPGNVGFDPLNLGTIFNFKYMQEAEIKHCRVAMLGVLGWIVPEFFTWPFEYFKAADPVAAHDYFVQTGGMGQILMFIAFFEVFGAIALRETIDGDREPGYFGFDPLGFSSNPEKKYRLATAELKNGRLAMISFGGLYHQYLMSHQGTIDQLTHFKGIPGHVF